MRRERTSFERGLARARRRYHDALPILQRPGVVGVGIGRRMFQGEHVDEACFVVYVREKKQLLDRWEKLPPAVCGVPVDVQSATWGALERSTGRSGRIWAHGRKEHETGSLGVVARRQGDLRHDLFALTAMHVLTPQGSTAIPRGSRVEIETPQGDRELGVVEDAVIGSRADVVLIRLGREETLLRHLAASYIEVREPIDRDDIAPGVPVGLSTGAKGKVVSVSCDVEQYSGLLQFRFQEEIEPGWSGSLIYAWGKRPLALLSFRAGDDHHTGFGWPIGAFYKHWNLAPWASEEV